MRVRYGFAQFPFRDPEGAVVPDGVEFKASYPWVDRAGKNFFFTTVSSMFFYATSSQPVTVKTRYQPDSLSPAALFPIAAPLEDDPRRQPSQPPPLVFGNVPAGYAPTTGLPSNAMQASTAGTSLDRWVFP